MFIGSFRRYSEKMADLGTTRPLNTETSSSENPRNYGLSQVSYSRRCLRSIIPVFLFLACVGFVVFVAGITSLVAHGPENGGAILAGVGCSVFAFGMFCVAVVKIKQVRSLKGATWQDDRTEMVAPYSTLRAYSAGGISAFTGLYPRSLLIPDGYSPPRYEDVIGSTDHALQPQIKTVSHQSKYESDTSKAFDTPPPYEEAVSFSGESPINVGHCKDVVLM